MAISTICAGMGHPEVAMGKDVLSDRHLQLSQHSPGQLSSIVACRKTKAILEL